MHRVVTVGFEVNEQQWNEEVSRLEQSENQITRDNEDVRIKENEEKEKEEPKSINQSERFENAEKEDKNISEEEKQIRTTPNGNSSQCERDLSASTNLSSQVEGAKDPCGSPQKKKEYDEEEQQKELKVKGEEETAQEETSPSKKKIVTDFTFGRVLGEGSFAVVNLATEIETGREFAVKILDKKQIIKDRKIKYVNVEKDVLERVNHPNIVHLYYTFQDVSSLYFVLELCPNGELLDLIHKAGSLSIECSAFYAAEIITALEYLHSLNIIHRDLKPENILLDPNWHVKLNDFGTAKILDSSTNGRSGSFTGTAEYVAPEMLRDKQTGKSGDLWALGCIIFQMLAGRPPFQGENEYQTFQLVINRNFEYPPNFPAVAKDLVDKLLNTEAHLRLGAGEKGFEELKNHSLFRGVRWESLYLQTPPKVIIRPKSRVDPPVASMNNLNIEPLVPSPAVHQETNNTLNLPRQLDEWEPFLVEDEKVIKTGVVWKRKGLFTKKRQLFLTDSPRLFYIEVEKKELKGQIPWSVQMEVTLRNNTHFDIVTPGRTYHLGTESSQSTKEWVDILSKLLVHYKSQQNVNS